MDKDGEGKNGEAELSAELYLVENKYRIRVCSTQRGTREERVQERELHDVRNIKRG